MKRLLLTIICALSCTLSYAQSGGVMYVSVIGEQLTQQEKCAIEDSFHEFLGAKYEIRLDQGRGIFSEEIYRELNYQEMSGAAVDEMKQFAQQKGADKLCVVIVEKGSNTLYYRAKVYSTWTATLECTARYPVYGDKTISDKPSVEDLQYVSSKLVERLGYTLPPDVEKANRSYELGLQPDEGGGDIRVLSTFSQNGIVGLGLSFHKSYFQLGFDLMLAGFSEFDPSYIDYSDDQERLRNDFTLLGVSQNVQGCDVGEYICPKFLQFSINPGLNFKYFAIECGLGVYSCHNVKVTGSYDSADGTWDDYWRNSYFVSELKAIKTSESYFMFRPTFVGYLPKSSVTISIGYQIVPKVKELNTLVFGIGTYW